MDIQEFKKYFDDLKVAANGIEDACSPIEGTLPKRKWFNDRINALRSQAAEFYKENSVTEDQVKSNIYINFNKYLTELKTVFFRQNPLETISDEQEYQPKILKKGWKGTFYITPPIKNSNPDQTPPQNTSTCSQ